MTDARPSVRLLPDNREEFVFTGQPRKIQAVEAVPFRWPNRMHLANDYVATWHELATAALAALKLSKSTLDQIASHISRRDGCIMLTDRALSSRSGRSLASTERDIRRLKDLGFLVTEYACGDGRQERIRVLKLAVPSRDRSPQRIPPEKNAEVPSTYPPYVEGLDMGERRDVE
jgi:hypothetical protein